MPDLSVLLTEAEGNGETRARPFPGIEFAEPGWSREMMASVTRVLGEGLYVGDYFDGETRMDIVVRVPRWETPEEFASIPLATPGGVLPVSELARVERTAGTNEIRRIDRRRTVTLQVTPPEGMSLEEAIEVVARLAADGERDTHGSRALVL